MQACDLLHKLCVQVEIKTTPKTVDVGHLQKAADFVHAFILGKHGNSALICHLLSADLHSLFGSSVQEQCITAEACLRRGFKSTH